MKKIYCIYCGNVNEFDKELCSYCKKKLHPKEHLWKDYITNHIKDDLKSNIEDNIFSYLTNFVKSHFYGVILSLVVFSSATTLVLQNTNSNYIEEVFEKPSEFIKENLDVNSSLVKKLYSYLDFNKELDTDMLCDDCTLDFYDNHTVTYDDFNDVIKLYISYEKADLDSSRTFVRYTSCEDINEYETIYKYCLENETSVVGANGTRGDFAFYTIDNDALRNSYHNIFGLDKNLPLGSYQLSPGKTCESSSITNDYLCYMVPSMYTNDSYEYTQIISAIKYGDYIFVYDYFIYIVDSYDTGTFKDRFQSKKLSDESDESLITSGQIYEHTFKLDSNGNYYWLRSEPVDEIKYK